MVSRRGRRKEIDPQLVERLASILCTYEEIAAVVGCGVSTLEKHFREVISRGHECGKASIRRAQFKLLQAGNATMAIWLGKQYLGQRDQASTEVTGPGGAQVIEVQAIKQILADAERAKKEV